MDYKNTPEGRAVQSKYADLLSLSRPAPIKSRMTIQTEPRFSARLLLCAVMRMRLRLRGRTT